MTDGGKTVTGWAETKSEAEQEIENAKNPRPVHVRFKHPRSRWGC